MIEMAQTISTTTTKTMLCSCLPQVACMIPDKKILFKKQLFDLEVKVLRRSLRYATHHLMVMHPHTKYNWSIWKDKKGYGGFAEKKPLSFELKVK
jgi:hypothetical protein